MNIKEIPFERSFASHPKAEFWSNKNKLKPMNITICNGNKYWFDCNKCNHEFEKRISDITYGGWCPYCPTASKILCNNNECLICFNNSFANNIDSKYWSSKNSVIPRNIQNHSNKNYWFNCKTCNIEINTSLKHIKQCKNCINNNKIIIIFSIICDTCNHIYNKSKIKNTGCPYCANQKLCENEECKKCFNKSFISQDKHIFWSNKNKLTPRQVFKASDKKYWFDCNKCNHDFEIILKNVTNLNNWCKYCANQSLCENKDCIECLKKSYASHEKSIYWSNKNKLSPQNVFISSNKKYWFDCKKCNKEFETPLSSNSWCPFCKNKTEGILYEWLNKNYQNVIFQPRFEWCKNKQKLPFDFLLENFKLIIELDGAQHFEQVSNWKSPEEAQEIDKFKMDCALENGCSIIRIKQDDIWNNKIDWKEILTNSIKKYDTPIIILHYPI